MGPKRILLLDDKTVSLIAAGEVVESPASIIKELIENSIDAESKSIVIEIRDGGKSYIRVTDDGCGIEEEDAELAFRRHTTSKMKNFSDFDRLMTNGFRGEALGSICAVSKAQMITKTRDSLYGSHLFWEGGKLLQQQKTGAKDGTTMIVEDIFFNTPARRKFLKSAQAETSKITDIVMKLSLANPSVRFKYINNNKVMLSTAGSGSVLDTIYSIYSKDLMSAMIEIDKKIGDVQLKGYIGHNTLMFSSRRYQHIFVNRRVIRGRELGFAAEEAYSAFIPSGNYPGFVLDIQVPPSVVDVNIHPNKLDIKFDRELQIPKIIEQTIRDCLNELVMIPKARIVPGEKKKNDEMRVENIFIEDILRSKEDTVAEQSLTVRSPQGENAKAGDGNEIFYSSSPSAPLQVRETFSSETEKEKSTFDPFLISETEDISYRLDFDYRDLKQIGVLFETYFVAQYKSSMYLVDQHAAHERILFEKYMKALQKDEVSAQILLSPSKVRLPLTLAGMEDEIIFYLRKKGFEIDLFGENELMIRAVPTMFTIEQGRAFIEEVIDIKAQDTKKAVLLNDRTAMKACKAAIKANDHLHPEEIDTILRELDACRNKYACPHGRPVIVEISKYEIEKMFKRVLK